MNDSLSDGGKEVAAAFSNSKISFLELKQALCCGFCKKLAVKPHILGNCDHTYCLTCATQLSGKECPLCGVCSKPEDRQPDILIGKILEAYLPLAAFLNLDKITPPGGALNNSIADDQDPGASVVLKHSSKDKGKTKTRDKENSLKKKNRSFTVPSSKGSSSKRLDRSSLNETLNGSMCSVSANKIDKRNIKGETPLQIACLKKDLARVNELLELGADPNTQDNAGWTPLHEAVTSGIEDIVKVLLDNGANPNIPGGQNETPLHEAVAYSRKTIVTILLSKGADPNARNSRGLTAKDLSMDDEMKGLLENANPVPTTPQNPDRLMRQRHTSQLPLVYFLNTEMKSQQLNKLGRTLGFKHVSSHTNQVTHVVVKLNEASMVIKQKYPVLYSAILLGQFIVDYKWIEASEKAGHLEDHSLYEVDGNLKPAPEGGTLSRNNAALQLPGLFNNCSFYLHGQFTTPTKTEVAQWIKHGTGIVLTRSPNPENVSPNKKVPYHASPAGPLAKCCYFIIYDQNAKSQPPLKYNMSHVKTLPVDWLIACIEHFALADPF